MPLRMLLLGTTALAAAIYADPTRACVGPASTTHVADVTCYGAQPNTAVDSAPAIQAAWNDAVALGVPLSLPGGRYKIGSMLNFDYGGAADRGVEIQANGSILDAADHPGVMPLYIHCSGGSPSSPVACFYLHISGTLHVYTNNDWWGVIIGDWTFADQENGTKVDHLDVNNSGGGSGVLFSSQYNADINVTANSAGGFALQLNRVQFSVFRGAAAAGPDGYALVLDDYTFANTFQSLDLEVSAWAVVAWQPQVSNNTFISPYINSLNGFWTYGTGAGNVLMSPMFGGGMTGYPNYPGNWIEK